MKKYKFFALAFAAMTLAACSSDDVVDNGAKPGAVAPGEQGYVSLAINLPSQQGTTRAEATTDQGTPAEYEVNNAKLLLFSGASEAAAAYKSAYDLDITGTGLEGEGQAGQITTSGQIVQKITVPTLGASDKLYALVVLNDNGLIDAEKGTVNGASISNLASFTAAAQDFSAKGGVNALTGDGIFMANAPLSSVAGGSATTAPTAANVKTLALVDDKKIYNNADDARKDPATTVYVERAVGKVTVTNSSSGTVSETGNKLTGYTVQGWALNVTNNKSYLVRNVDAETPWWGYTTGTSTNYRFVGSATVATGGPYRTYWGIDPNYDKYVAADFTVKADNSVLASTNLTSVGETNPLYCLENTFDVANMNENQTTMVVVKAKLTVTGQEGTSGDFYTINDIPSTIYTNATIKEYVQDYVMDWVDDNIKTYVSSGTIDGKNLEVTLSSTTNGGYITVSKVELPESAASGITWATGQDRDKFNTALATQVTAFNSAVKIGYYKNGEAYYKIPIKHFGDETPWEQSGAIAYPGADNAQKWLGRYGVLRNNWYSVNIKSITNIGSPSVPSVTVDPDDSPSSYISATINVLSWSKRTQDVDL